ncbi:hypothetical protein MGYG_07218 [Nannizzia gypsea CBS 118893]|uniref:Centromere protein X n=1 Tax=Arthroderma gypseum (strain ATCC MYA-4604 / CBS 118893) TaxID=535722 RepID=E4V2E6_ARTGP|nr:hypothetical protein MGYG_07218 [Nannizzia gypsea CBS 118893]EFR04211.1 hypothetical protein MGYG_07218 [Nannizzia gypsea CBS 118893]
MAPTEIKGKKAGRPQKPSVQTADAREKATKKGTEQKLPLKRRSTAGGNNQTTPSSTIPSKRQKQTKETSRTSSSISSNRDEGISEAEDRFSSEEPDFILAEIITVDGPKQHPADSKSSEPRIDYKLITTILHEVAFKKQKTRVTKDGVKLFTKYIESFVTEAVSRSIEEKRASNTAAMATLGTRTDLDHRNYLETEDLERAYPQLMLDF